MSWLTLIFGGDTMEFYVEPQCDFTIVRPIFGNTYFQDVVSLEKGMDVI
jgi:hypothetical protein